MSMPHSLNITLLCHKIQFAWMLFTWQPTAEHQPKYMYFLSKWNNL